MFIYLALSEVLWKTIDALRTQLFEITSLRSNCLLVVYSQKL